MSLVWAVIVVQLLLISGKGWGEGKNEFWGYYIPHSTHVAASAHPFNSLIGPIPDKQIDIPFRECPPKTAARKGSNKGKKGSKVKRASPPSASKREQKASKGATSATGDDNSDEPVERTLCPVPGCGWSFPGHERLTEHLQKAHPRYRQNPEGGVARYSQRASRQRTTTGQTSGISDSEFEQVFRTMIGANERASLQPDGESLTPELLNSGGSIRMKPTVALDNFPSEGMRFYLDLSTATGNRFDINIRSKVTEALILTAEVTLQPGYKKAVRLYKVPDGRLASFKVNDTIGEECGIVNGMHFIRFTGDYFQQWKVPINNLAYYLVNTNGTEFLIPAVKDDDHTMKIMWGYSDEGLPLQEARVSTRPQDPQVAEQMRVYKNAFAQALSKRGVSEESIIWVKNFPFEGMSTGVDNSSPVDVLTFKIRSKSRENRELLTAEIEFSPEYHSATRRLTNFADYPGGDDIQTVNHSISSLETQPDGSKVIEFDALPVGILGYQMADLSIFIVNPDGTESLTSLTVSKSGQPIE